MFKLMSLSNVDHFLRVVDASRGDVLLRLPDDSRCNLKKDRPARQLLRLMAPGPDGLELELSELADLPAFLRYMLESARS